MARIYGLHYNFIMQHIMAVVTEEMRDSNKKVHDIASRYPYILQTW